MRSKTEIGYTILYSKGAKIFVQYCIIYCNLSWITWCCSNIYGSSSQFRLWLIEFSKSVQKSKIKKKKKEIPCCPYSYLNNTVQCFLSFKVQLLTQSRWRCVGKCSLLSTLSCPLLLLLLHHPLVLLLHLYLQREMSCNDTRHPPEGRQSQQLAKKWVLNLNTTSTM